MRQVLSLVLLPGLFLLQTGTTASGQAKPARPPELPYFDWNACPFEGCVYRQWTARELTPLYDTWKHNRRRIAQVVAGEKVVAVTGVVITFKPGVIRMDRDVPEASLNKGDTILTYTYRGEGFSAVWYKSTYDPSFDISFTKWPDGAGCGGEHCAATYIDLGKKEWWAQVRFKSGRTGWVDMNTARFDGVDWLANPNRGAQPLKPFVSRYP